MRCPPNVSLAVAFSALAAAGCYRSAALELNGLRTIETTRDGRLHVRYAGGTSETYSRVDRLRVDSTVLGEQEFRTPVGATLANQTLLVQDPSDRTKFAWSDVEDVEVRARAPERVWIILGSTVAAGVLGALVGSAAGPRCDQEWGCFGKAVYGSAGFLIGITAGVVLSIPLSARLTPERSQAAGPRE